jgi:hypothetical protein
MAYLTVVEAAGLSGLSPHEVRELIQRGHLPARLVPAEAGPAYLVDNDTLVALSLRGLASGAPNWRTGNSAESAPLLGALLGLRAALARRQAASSAPSRSTTANPEARRRGAIGLSRDELQILAARVDRLLWVEEAQSLQASTPAVAPR